MRVGRPLLLAAGLTVLPVACSTEVSLPGDALIGCADASECPSGHLCHRGLCVRPEGIDTTPPDLAGTPAVTPAVGRAGTTFTVDLAATEPLLDPPELTLSLVPPVGVPCAADGGGYRCEYTATGDENGGLGGVVAFDVRLRDRSRNETLRTLAGALHLDYTAPALAAASVEPAAARLGGVVQVFLATSEPLGAAPVLVASRPLDHGGAQTRFTLDPQPGTLNHAFTHLVTAADPLGVVTFTVELGDLAGNGATLEVGSVTLDPVVPVLGPVAVSPARIDATGTVTVGFDVSEPAARLAVTIGGRPAACGPFQPTAGGAGTYACTRAMAGTEIPAGTEAAQSVVVEVEDAAGNRATGGGSVVFDFRPPALTLATVGYLPAPGNPLATVTAATAGTRIRVAVAADEELAGVPAVTATSGGTTLAFALVPGTFTGTGATLEAAVPAGAPDGDYAPQVSWSDLAGNEATLGFTAPAIRVKTSTPTLVVDQDAIVFVRSPWGNGAAEDLGGYVVPAGPYFAVEPSDALSSAGRLPAGCFLLDGGTTPSAVLVQLSGEAGGLRLATLLPGFDGTWPRQPLASPDVATVHLVGLDQAGNRSTAVQVRDGEWVATARPPSAGVSPHHLVGVPRVSSSRVQYLGVVRGDGPEAAGADSLALLARGWDVWRERTTSATTPVSVYGPALAYDSARGRTVMFGGREGTTLLRKTWEWDGSSWTDASPEGQGPSARSGNALAYDSARGRVVLFGGYDATGRLRDTWEWDGSTWTEVAPGAVGPGARDSHAMAYDSARERVVLFGGMGPSGALSDTWEWDGSSWAEVTPTGPAPSARYGTALAFDGRRGRVVLFGGRDVTGSRQDTWEWTGTTWSNVSPPGTSPGARQFHGLAWDSARQRVVLFGGLSYEQDTWEWDGSGWSNVAPAGSGPVPGGPSAIAYDVARQRVVLSVLRMGSAQETWEWDGQSWANVTPVEWAQLSRGLNPEARAGPAMAYDEAHGVSVLFGGEQAGSPLDASAWLWNGRAWTSVPPSSVWPSARSSAAMVGDQGRGRVVLFGGIGGTGYLQDTWEWDGGTNSWTMVNPPVKPAARHSPAMAYDSARGRTVLFGGYGVAGYLQDTWEWNGSTWVDVTPPGASPSARFGHAMAYDRARARVVVFGGRDATGRRQDTWEWNGSGWATMTPAGTLPVARANHSMAYDPWRGRVVLFGGARGQSVGDELADLWEWDGQAWTEVTPATGSPPGRFLHGATYDSRTRRLVVVGGYGTYGWLGDTWEHDAASPDHQPALQFDVSSLSTGFTRQSVTALRVRAFAGGAFSPGGPADTGATLLAWTSHDAALGPGAWVELASNTAGVAAQQPYLGPPSTTLIDWSAASGDQARRFLSERDGVLSFQVRPTGVTGPDPGGAVVALDYAEVRVRYAAP